MERTHHVFKPKVTVAVVDDGNGHLLVESVHYDWERSHNHGDDCSDGFGKRSSSCITAVRFVDKKLRAANGTLSQLITFPPQDLGTILSHLDRIVGDI